MQKITAISLFCGVGGIDLGFKQAGNSVTVTVIQQIAKNIVFALNNNNLNNNKAINTQLSLFKF